MFLNSVQEIPVSTHHFSLTPEQRKQRHDLLSAVNNLTALTRAMQAHDAAGFSTDFHTKELITKSQQSLARLRQFVEQSFTTNI